MGERNAPRAGRAPVEGSIEWNAQQVLENLKLEQKMLPTTSQGNHARRIFDENVAACAASIVHIALHSADERIRLKAAAYVVETVLKTPDVGEDPNMIGETIHSILEELGFDPNDNKVRGIVYNKLMEASSGAGGTR